ncbi:ATP-binding protein [Alteromonas macleodii]|uniref:ATP-binding protein n=1 Tax=Alteromonas macleodii TaxID=28108 RepID=UPI003BF816D5
MKKSISFQTRARAIDHLGREQIADVPTAVSELWKNAFDAYARNAELHLFNDEENVAALVDDGHGMTIDDLVNKWLVIGTESKAATQNDTEEDRDGLPLRPKQGQKGIGRLSSAALGPLLLLISKKKNDNFVALLIDWRLFENPFLFLDDIKIPIEEFESKNQLSKILPSMYDELMGNIWGSEQKINEPEDETAKTMRVARNDRIIKAWQEFSSLEVEQKKTETTQSRIAETIIHSTFNEHHLLQWPVWSGQSPKGTALFISNIHEDLLAQYGDENDPLVLKAKETFFSTLISFTSHIVEDHLEEFKYAVKLHKGLRAKNIVSPAEEFSKADFESMEHQVHGEIDDDAVFRGEVTAFGNLLGKVEIPLQYKMPSHARSRVGKLKVLLASFEADKGQGELGGRNTSMEASIWANIYEKINEYGGLKVYRDGLRVMPYGRPDNDFFEIEARRSSNAGLYHYSLRNMVGAISLSSSENKNLRDKAGREGFIESKASKAFREVVILLLKEVAKRYFGRNPNSLRHEILPSLQDDYRKRKAESDLEKAKKKQRKAFSGNLKTFEPKVNALLDEVEEYVRSLESKTPSITLEQVVDLQKQAEQYLITLSENKITHAPKKLSPSQEQKFRQYKDNYGYINNTLKSSIDSLNQHLEKLQPKAPEELAKNRANRNIRYVLGQLKSWESQASEIIGSEKQRLSDMISKKHEEFKGTVNSFVDEVERGQIGLGKCLELIDGEMEKHQALNEETFVPYINALHSLQENIDLAGLADFTIEKSSALQEEVDRLNSLAQLGITVEVIGHELNHMQFDADSALEKVNAQLTNEEDSKNLKRAYTALTNKLKFLSPLKLSGESVREWISGKEIVDYCVEFFGDKLTSIDFFYSKEFEKFQIYEQRSQIYPVFINLLNNSIYWVRQKEQSEYKISLDIVEGKVVIADNGTGVYPDDISSLFTIFFTKKTRGGRGVGLYLCRRNLATGGHKIHYATEQNLQILSGANFVIEFKGIKHA